MAVNGTIRSIGGITAQVTVREEHRDEAVITQHPVERSAPITDHAYVMPSSLTVTVGWSNSSAGAGRNKKYINEIYEKLLALFRARAPFTVITGKRTYQNMLIQGIEAMTDQETDNVLMASLSMREIITATTQTITFPPPEVQAAPQETSGVVQKGAKQPQPTAVVVPAKQARERFSSLL